MKTPYQCIIFDADNTLFHWDAFLGLKHMFAGHGIDFTQQDFHDYESANQPLWKEYEKGLITANDVKERRFAKWAARLNVSAMELNNAFLHAMSHVCTPLEGAMSLLNTLKGKCKLGIITNGFTALQQARIEALGLQDYFDAIVISEAFGVAKPHRDIFDHTLSLLNCTNRDQVLMVGDTLDTDIIGGLNAGLHTCWLNIHCKVRPEHVKPHYEVNALSQLESILNAILKQ